MSILDEQGKWRKHWFVLADTSLKYYRDSEAEESDDLEGEIDLTSCVNVSDCEVERNYGLQIQTKRALFTLSAITSRIQQNWVKLLKQAVKNNALQSDSCGEKEYPLSQNLSSSQPPARFTCNNSGGELAISTYTAAAASPFREDHQTAAGDLGADLSPTSQRDEGEGWDREQAKRLEERNKWFEEGVPLSEMSSRWDSMELKRGSVPVPVTETIDSELNRKWAEFETLSFSEMSPQSLIGAQVYPSDTQQQSIDLSRTHHRNSEVAEQSEASLTGISGGNPRSENGVQIPTAETLQKEAISLRQQVESIKRERAAMRLEVDSPCGPTAPCRALLEEMVASHRKALQELQEKHAREMKQLEEERDRLLLVERQAATTAMEALKAAHREELERARRLCGETAHMDSSHGDQMPRADALHGELNALSEQYSQKCLELSCTEQNSKRREAELDFKKRELQQLQRENQELKTKLAEEISRMRYFITGQRSEVVSLGNTEHTVSDLEMLLKAKENEVQTLRKEMACLQNQVQTLTKEKDAAYERYKEAYVELTATRGRSHLEMNALNEHRRLANAALQEEERQT
uniref:PH domain-containing protein n=1 Tax=Oryzias latipes TaxID=8090 RepID=A0A3P9M1G9_ORYLA